MSKVTKRTLNIALDKAMGKDVELKNVQDAQQSASDGLAETCRKCWKQPGGKDVLADWLFDMAGDTEARAGNPFHKARQTLNTRCRISVKVVTEEDEVIDIELKAMPSKKDSKKKTVDPSKAYDALSRWIETRAKSNPEFAKALLSFNAQALRKAINDGARDAGVKL